MKKIQSRLRMPINQEEKGNQPHRKMGKEKGIHTVENMNVSNYEKKRLMSLGIKEMTINHNEMSFYTHQTDKI